MAPCYLLIIFPGSHYDETTRCLESMHLCTSGRRDHRTCLCCRCSASMCPIGSSVGPGQKLRTILGLHCSRPAASYSAILVLLHAAVARGPALCLRIDEASVHPASDEALVARWACACHCGLRICTLCDLDGRHSAARLDPYELHTQHAHDRSDRATHA